VGGGGGSAGRGAGGSGGGGCWGGGGGGRGGGWWAGGERRVPYSNSGSRARAVTGGRSGVPKQPATLLRVAGCHGRLWNRSPSSADSNGVCDTRIVSVTGSRLPARRRTGGTTSLIRTDRGSARAARIFTWTDRASLRRELTGDGGSAARSAPPYIWRCQTARGTGDLRSRGTGGDHRGAGSPRSSGSRAQG